MNSSDAIGGYFELGVPDNGSFLHDDAVLLNSGRAAFEYILRAQKPSKVYLPRFTCDAMMQPLERAGTEYEFYIVTEQLELADSIELGDGELLVYNDYFGLRDDYSRQLAEKYGDKLVLDCAQALYMQPLEHGHTFYSTRKFFGLPDGGMLYTPGKLDTKLEVDESYGRSTQLLKRLDVGAEAGYGDFKAAEQSLDDAPLKAMSRLTKRLLTSLDFEVARKVRIANYQFLHERLGQDNKLSLPENPTGPLCYPLLADAGLRDKLIAHKIFTPQYWPNVLTWSEPGSVEYGLSENIVALPIDQRYNTDDMAKILEVIHG